MIEHSSNSSVITAPGYREFRGTRSSAGFIVFLILFGIGCVLTPLILGIWSGLFAYERFGPGSVIGWSSGWVFIFSVGLAILFLLVFIVVNRSLPIVKISKHGLWVKFFLLPNKYIKWTDISGISEKRYHYQLLGKTMFDRFSTKLYLSDGHQLTFNQKIQNFSALISYIKAAIYPEIYTIALEKLKNGKIVSCGAISFDCFCLKIEQGFIHKEISIPWENILSIGVNNGILSIEYRQRPGNNTKLINLPTDRIHNLEPMMRLLKEEITQ